MPIKVHVVQRGLEKSIQRAARNVNRHGLKIDLNERSFARPLGRITGAVSEFNKSLESSNARVLAFGASVGIIQGVQRGFANLVKTVATVEAALADVNVVLGISEKKLEAFGDSLFKVAKNTAQGFDVVAVAATEFARQGLTIEETLKRTNDALILTRLTGLDAASAVKGLTAAINTFNRAGITSSQILSKMAAVDVQFAVSTQDLIDAVSRAGAVAEDAGVSFDQLLGAVTAAQQATARGGKVIGNSYKTIFTRIQRGTTIDSLERLGIATRDVSGNTLPAIQALTNLAKIYDTLADSAKAAVAEQVGGVFQINILKAMVKDLANENSVLSRATKAAADATDEAYRKNELLNKTLKALASQTGTAIQDLADTIGKLTLEDGIKGWLGAIKYAAEQFKGELTEDDGLQIGKRLLKGIGNAFAGPGVLAFMAVFAALFVKTMGFLRGAIGEMLNITTQAGKLKAIEAQIVAVLGENSALQQKILGQEGNRAAQEKIILNILRQQAFEQEKIRAAAASMAGGLARAGYGANLQKAPRRGRSSGHIPNFASKEERDIEKAGARGGGYAPGAVKSMLIPGEGKVLYNSAEKVKNFSGMSQPAIMPPRQSPAGRGYGKSFQKVHGFDPYASGGHIPNYGLRIGPGAKGAKKGAKAKKEKFDDVIGMGVLRTMLNQTSLMSIRYKNLNGNLETISKFSGMRSGVHKGKKGRKAPFHGGRNPAKSVKAITIPKDPVGKEFGHWHGKHDGKMVRPGERFPDWNSWELHKGMKNMWVGNAKGGNRRRFELSRIKSIKFEKQNYKVDPSKAAEGFVPNYALWAYDPALKKRGSKGGFRKSSNNAQDI